MVEFSVRWAEILLWCGFRWKLYGLVLKPGSCPECGRAKEPSTQGECAPASQSLPRDLPAFIQTEFPFLHQDFGMQLFCKGMQCLPSSGMQRTDENLGMDTSHRSTRGPGSEICCSVVLREPQPLGKLNVTSQQLLVLLKCKINPGLRLFPFSSDFVAPTS